MLIGSLFAQYIPDVSNMNEVQKMMLFEQNKKKPATAMLYGLLFPSLGHLYLNDYSKSKKYLAANTVVLLVPLSLAIEVESGDDNDGQGLNMWGSETKEDDLIIYWSLGFGILRGLEIFDISSSIKQYNDNLYRKIFNKEPPSFSLNLQPTYKGANLNLAYSFK